MNTPLRVYLDSADYSSLSDPRRATAVSAEIVERFVALRDARQVEFWFSGLHISEMAPLEDKSVEAAIARGQLLAKLCRKNALVSFDQLIELELRAVSQGDTQPSNVFAPDGTWFPDIGPVFEPISRMNVAAMVDELIREQGGNRSARRAAMRSFSSEGALREQFLAKLKAEGRADPASLIAEYPMRPEDARTISEYFLGRASPADAEAAFLASFRDLVWMMQWFRTKFDHMSAISRWARSPAQAFYETAKRTAIDFVALREHVARIRASAGSEASSLELPELSAGAWRKRYTERLPLMVTNLAKRLCDIQLDENLDLQLLHTAAPGLCTTWRVMHESTWAAVEGRNLRESDWVDGAHSMYAPYVDVFRADKFMAQHVRRAVKSYGTTVVSRIEDVVQEVERLLDDNRERVA